MGGKIFGNGKVITPRGSVIEGEWAEGVQKGSATYWQPDL